MKAAITVLLLGSLIGCQSRTAPICQVEPQIFCESFEQLYYLLENDVRDELRSYSDDEIWKLHHGFGTEIRNRFGLWSENELTRFFRDNGVDHPDYMSGIFISGFVRYLQEVPVDMKVIISPSAISESSLNDPPA